MLSVDIVSAQVQLRDTTIEWQHHEFELNNDYSMGTYSQADSDVEKVSFAKAKVIENDLIKLTLLPEYGGRVLSFFYKPTQHEYLYQSECGSAYNIGNGIFYYDWLMVYGGIFPTFPEPEHGKTWLLDWDYSVIKNTPDTVTVRMQYTDDWSFSKAPSNYNNGTTNLTCQVDVSVYKYSSIWDFDVSIINGQGNKVDYEYWTCTTLAPGSDANNTGTPVNSEIVIPSEKYFAGWSPRAWIGRVNSTYDMSDINLLSEWEDMGIAYADDFQGKYWGVINHENQEGVFRVSENIETKGVKLWTWGRNNVDNDMFDFSNGGADNYIELWGGVSESFFTDATIGANENKNWKESYCPTVNLSAICNMNNYGGVNLIWDNEKSQVTYELNTFHSNEAYTVKLRIDGNGRDEEFANESIDFEALGRIKNFSLEGLNLSSGTYTIHFDLLDKNNKVALATSKSIETGSVSSRDDLASAKPLDIELRALGNRKMYAQFPETGKHDVEVYSLDGKLLSSHEFTGSSLAIQLPCSGLYFIAIEESNKLFMQKIFVY
mgnify:CR=1 FL=1